MTYNLNLTCVNYFFKKKRKIKKKLKKKTQVDKWHTISDVNHVLTKKTKSIFFFLKIRLNWDNLKVVEDRLKFFNENGNLR